jgi:hypothetical protein
MLLFLMNRYGLSLISGVCPFGLIGYPAGDYFLIIMDTVKLIFLIKRKNCWQLDLFQQRSKQWMASEGFIPFC